VNRSDISIFVHVFLLIFCAATSAQTFASEVYIPSKEEIAESDVEIVAGEDKTIYECKFMTVKNNGFSFGFSVVSYFEIINGVVKLISLRTQPLDVESASDIAPFVDSVSGKDFVNYDLVKEKATPTLSELEMAKNKLQ
jgi:hypothetical protein